MSDEKMNDVFEELDIDATDEEIESEELDSFPEDFRFLIDDVKSSMKDLDKEISRIYDEIGEKEASVPELADFENEKDYHNALESHRKLILMERRYKLKCAETVAKMVTAKKQYAQHLMDLYSKRNYLLKKAGENNKDNNDGSSSGGGLTASQVKELIDQENAKKEEELF